MSTNRGNSSSTHKRSRSGRKKASFFGTMLYYLIMTVFSLWIISIIHLERYIDNELMKNENNIFGGSKAALLAKFSLNYGKNVDDDITEEDIKQSEEEAEEEEYYNDDLEKEDPYEYLTMYGKHRFQNSFDALPEWLQEYFTWHRSQTAKDAIINKNSKESSEVKYAVLTCLPEDPCGGLSDRLRPLPFYLYVAKHTNRVLCIYWKKNFGLEEYLQPIPDIGIEWRCPKDIDQYYDITKLSKKQKKVGMFKYGFCRKNKIPFEPCVESDIQKMNEKMQGRYATISLITREPQRINNANLFVQRHSYGGLEQPTNGHYLMPAITNWQFPEMIEHIFRVMFEPIPTLAKRINTTMARLGLVENEFATAHLRARYPTGALKYFIGHLKFDLEGGLKFEGDVRNYMIDLLKNVLKCSHLLAPDLKLFLISDHNEVTRYAIENDINVAKRGKRKEIYERPVGIDRDQEPLHMEGKHSSKTAADFYPVFEDLLIMGGSKCVTHGIGSFGSFGAGLSGNRCRAIHRRHDGKAVSCPNDRIILEPMIINATDMAFGEKPGGKGKLTFDRSKYIVPE